MIKPLGFFPYALVCGVGLLVLTLEQAFMSNGQERTLVWNASECRLGKTEINSDWVDATALCPNQKPVEINNGATSLLNSMFNRDEGVAVDTAGERFNCFQEHLVWSDRDEVTCSTKSYEEVLEGRQADD